MNATLAKGLDVLEWLVRQQRECRLVEVAEAHQLGRSNAHRTLRTLVASGWVVQNASSSGYRASMRLFELGALVEGTGDLKASLRTHLDSLARSSGETIHLAVLDGAEIIYVDKIDSPLPVAAYSRIGGRAPAYCVASGKALLAARELDTSQLQHLLGVLRPHTPNTITRIKALHEELAQTGRRGWAENREEWRVGVCGLGATVFNARGEAVAAIGMSVPTMRFAKVRARALARQTMNCALEASKALGFGAAALAVTQSPSLPRTNHHHNRRKP